MCRCVGLNELRTSGCSSIVIFPDTLTDLKASTRFWTYLLMRCIPEITLVRRNTLSLTSESSRRQTKMCGRQLGTPFTSQAYARTTFKCGCVSNTMGSVLSVIALWIHTHNIKSQDPFLWWMWRDWIVTWLIEAMFLSIKRFRWQVFEAVWNQDICSI